MGYLRFPSLPCRAFIASLVNRHDVTRGLSLFLGGFAAMNLAVGTLRPGFDANLWWIDLRWLPAAAAKVLTAGIALLLLLHAINAPILRRKRNTAALAMLAASGIALANALVFWQLLGAGAIQSSAPLPLSLFIAAGLTLIAWDMHQVPACPAEARSSSWRTMLRTARIGSLAVCFALAFALAQMIFFGKTDYTRRADAAIVFGARVYADGRMSDALADRVRTACDLYHRGVIARLIFSGGPGDGAVSEPQAMRTFALRSGVPANAILLDERGLSTQATVDQTRHIMTNAGVNKALAISHFYHLPRIKLAYQRGGTEVYTVPAKESYTLTALPMYVAREAAAWWWYYVRPVVG